LGVEVATVNHQDVTISREAKHIHTLYSEWTELPKMCHHLK